MSLEKLVLVPVRSFRGVRRCQVCRTALGPWAGSRLILEMANLTNAKRSCLQKAHGIVSKNGSTSFFDQSYFSLDNT